MVFVKKTNTASQVLFSNFIGDLKKNIEHLIGKERAEGNLDPIFPLYIFRLLNVPVENVEKLMKEMNV